MGLCAVMQEQPRTGLTTLMIARKRGRGGGGIELIMRR